MDDFATIPALFSISTVNLDLSPLPINPKAKKNNIITKANAIIVVQIILGLIVFIGLRINGFITHSVSEFTTINAICQIVYAASAWKEQSLSLSNEDYFDGLQEIIKPCEV